MDEAKIEVPENLFKYTNLDTLALILHTKKLRLNPLSAMDDLQEEMSQDKKDYGKYCFVSSWTEEEQEIIPMWKMYCNPGCGVRLQMPSDSIQQYKFEPPENMKDIPFSGEKLQVHVNSHRSEVKNCMPTEWCTDPFLSPVNYSDDPDRLFPKVMTTNHTDAGVETHLHTDTFGLVKNKYWNFQNEWRFHLFFIPLSFKRVSDYIFQRKMQYIPQAIEEAGSLDFNYIDLNIKPETLSKMKVISAPDITVGNELILKNLCSDCGISYARSSLFGQIRHIR